MVEISRCGGRERLSVIIVNFNTQALLKNCLASIRQSGERDLELIVVDNHSTDGSVDMVCNDFPEVRLTQNSNNLGFAKANNQGMNQARGKYILLLNSDTVVRPGAFQAMTDFLEEHSGAGAVTCRLLNEDGSTQASVSKRPSPLSLLFRILGLSRLFQADRTRSFLRKYFGFLLGSTVRSYLDPYIVKDSPVEVEAISGACLMLRRDAIDQVGLLDENFFMYLEDMDYCIRIQDAGWRLYYIPTGEIVHLVGQSSGGRMRNYSSLSYRSLFYFYRKHHSSLTLLIVRILVLASTSIRWLWSLVSGLFSSSSLSRRNRLDLAEVIRLCFE
jgi:GT2 family glycosyltransferase